MSSASQSGAISTFHGRVDYIDGPFAGQDAPDFAGGACLESLHCFFTVPRNVRIDDHVVTVAQRMWIGQWLRIGGIERRACNLSGVERPHERIRVHDRSARAIDEP